MNEEQLTRITSNDPHAAYDPSLAEMREAWLAFGSLLEDAAPEDDRLVEQCRYATRRRTVRRRLLASAAAVAGIVIVASIAYICYPGGAASVDDEAVAYAVPAAEAPASDHSWDDDWDTQIESVRRRVLLFDVDTTANARCESLPLSRRVQALSEELRSDSI